MSVKKCPLKNLIKMQKVFANRIVLCYYIFASGDGGMADALDSGSSGS